MSGRSFYVQFLRWWWGSKQKCPKGGGSWVSCPLAGFRETCLSLSRLLGGPPACLGPAPLPASSFQEGVYLTGQVAVLTYALGRLHACQARPGTCCSPVASPPAFPRAVTAVSLALRCLSQLGEIRDEAES